MKAKTSSLFLAAVLCAAILVGTTAAEEASDNLKTDGPPAGLASGEAPVLSNGEGEAWLSFHHDNQNTGRTQVCVPDEPELLWTYETREGGMRFASAAITAEGRVYMGCLGNYLYALGSNGSPIWSFYGDGEVNSAPAVDSTGNVYVDFQELSLIHI